MQVKGHLRASTALAQEDTAGILWAEGQVEPTAGLGALDKVKSPLILQEAEPQVLG
jgi:hypothetical protein